MTLTPERRTPLPLAGPHGSRSWATCHYRCGNACDQPEPNTSGHEHVSSVIATAVRRRSVLGGAAAFGAGALVLSGAAGPAAASGVAARPRAADAGPLHRPLDPGRPQRARHGDGARRLPHPPGRGLGRPGAARRPGLRPYRQTPESAAMQFGYNNDYVGVLPLDRRSRPAGGQPRVHQRGADVPAGHATTAPPIKRIAMASHGLSVVEIQRAGGAGSWKRTNPRRRRTTAGSPRPPSSSSTARPPATPGCGPPPTRPAGPCSAPSTTAPAARRRGARCCPARRTSTSTSTGRARSTRATPRATPATASPAPAAAAGARSTRAST